MVSSLDGKNFLEWIVSKSWDLKEWFDYDVTDQRKGERSKEVFWDENGDSSTLSNPVFRLVSASSNSWLDLEDLNKKWTEKGENWGFQD